MPRSRNLPDAPNAHLLPELGDGWVGPIAAPWRPALPPRNSLLLERGSLFALANSLFLVAGNSSLTPRSGSKISAHPPPGGPDFREIPCIFPAYQGIGRGDEFAPDCFHRQLVGRRRDSAPGARSGSPKPRDCAGFWARALVDPNRRPRVPGLEDAAVGTCLCCQVRRFGFASDSP